MFQSQLFGFDEKVEREILRTQSQILEKNFWNLNLKFLKSSWCHVPLGISKIGLVFGFEGLHFKLLIF